MNIRKPIYNLCHIYNDDTINIFSDASFSRNTGCYSVAVICKDNILEYDCRIVSNATVPESELKGIRYALSLAHKWKYQFKNINIFSDSKISVFGLREYFQNWKLKNYVYYGTSKKPIANQNVFLECHDMLVSLYNQGININLYHQKGHIDNKYTDLYEAAYSFKNENFINTKIDLNLIRYISTYNNYVDNCSRSYLRNNLRFKNQYSDPIIFFPIGCPNNDYYDIKNNNKNIL